MTVFHERFYRIICFSRVRNGQLRSQMLTLTGDIESNPKKVYKRYRKESCEILCILCNDVLFVPPNGSCKGLTSLGLLLT